MDSIGAKELAKDFVVDGTASESLYGACESMFKPDMREELGGGKGKGSTHQYDNLSSKNLRMMKHLKKMEMRMNLIWTHRKTTWKLKMMPTIRVQIELSRYLKREREKLVDCGLKICDFPIAIKRLVNIPNSSVFGIVEVERVAHNGESRGQGQGTMAVLENISYGQLLTLSAVPRDSPALLGSPMEETASGSDVGSHVMVPCPVIPGHGIIKRFGSKIRVHVVPVHTDWFSPNSVHRLERQVAPHFFSGKSAELTPEKYMEGQNYIVAKYMENPESTYQLLTARGL